MRLVDAINNGQGLIILSPGGKSVEGTEVEGEVSIEWFTSQFPELSDAQTPLEGTHLERLSAIDQFWRANVARWRQEKRI